MLFEIVKLDLNLTHAFESTINVLGFLVIIYSIRSTRMTRASKDYNRPAYGYRISNSTISSPLKFSIIKYKLLSIRRIDSTGLYSKL
jgi:hypothetical protein